MNIEKAHRLLGHMSEESTQKSAQALDWKLTRGTLGVCEPCSILKARRKNLPREDNVAKATKINDRMYLDQATLRKRDGSLFGKAYKVWCLTVLEWSGLKHWMIHHTKNAMIEPMCERLNRMKANNMMPKYLRMDNAGENVKLQKRAEGKDWKLGLEYEFTAEGTPQQNAMAEVAITTILNRAKAMTEAANVPKDKIHLLLPKAIETATLLDGLQVIHRNGELKTRYEHQVGENPPFVNHLRTWGEAGTVAIKDPLKTKSKPKGIVCMMVGYPVDHPGDCYEMWDPNTGGYHKTQDVTWLRRMFYKPSSRGYRR
jgi:hypothetical protein